MTKDRLYKPFFIDEKNVETYVDKMATWIKELVVNSKTNGAVLGMSGGIDCSVVARLCQVAEIDIHLVLMPYGSDMKDTKSYEHSMELINKFSISHHIFDIKKAVDGLTETNEQFLTNISDATKSLSYANIRPRVRMTYLYQLAQLWGRLVAGTGNMAERTVGYFTKWGDGGCDFNPMAMLTKQEVYTVAKYLGIPDSIITKKPSAGLWEGQTDEAELGMTYDQIDNFILKGTSGNKTIDEGIMRKMASSAHKFDEIPIFKG